MAYISLAVSATWEDYEHLLDLRGDDREPSLAFDTDKVGIDGYSENWNENVKAYVQELLEDEEDLLDTIAAEKDKQRISWEEIKQILGL